MSYHQGYFFLLHKAILFARVVFIPYSYFRLFYYLQLTILNKSGRIWTMVAGGGASVIYSDTICDLGGASELANYGEYSGAPSEQQTYEYAKTILSLMIQEKHPEGKVIFLSLKLPLFTFKTIIDYSLRCMLLIQFGNTYIINFKYIQMICLEETVNSSCIENVFFNPSKSAIMFA